MLPILLLDYYEITRWSQETRETKKEKEKENWFEQGPVHYFQISARL